MRFTNSIRTSLDIVLALFTLSAGLLMYMCLYASRLCGALGSDSRRFPWTPLFAFAYTLASTRMCVFSVCVCMCVVQIVPVKVIIHYGATREKNIFGRISLNQKPVLFHNVRDNKLSSL